MKKMILALMLTGVLATVNVNAQSNATDLQKGTIVTASNEKVEGSIKDLTKNKGNIVFTSSSGQKKTYSPADLSGFTLNGVNYISYASDFYKLISAGNKASLYQRVTDNSGKMLYNGAEVVSVTTAEGKAGDYYIQVRSDSKWIWITQKNFETSATAAFADCATVLNTIKTKQTDFTQIAKLTEQYNSCQ